LFREVKGNRFGAGKNIRTCFLTGARSRAQRLPAETLLDLVEAEPAQLVDAACWAKNIDAAAPLYVMAIPSNCSASARRRA